MNIYFVKTQILKIIQKNAFENPIKISKKNQKIFFMDLLLSLQECFQSEI